MTTIDASLRALEIQGTTVPKLGFGTWQIEGRECQEAVEDALAIGTVHRADRVVDDAQRSVRRLDRTTRDLDPAVRSLRRAADSLNEAARATGP